MFVENVLLGLLLAYFLIFMAIALVKSRKYLKLYSQRKDNKDDLFQAQNFSLALSGLCVTRNCFDGKFRV